MLKLAFAAVFFVVSAGAQHLESAAWIATVRPAIGKTVQVRMTSGTKRQGLLIDIGPDSMRLKIQQSDEVIRRADVRAVLARSRSRRVAHGAIVGAIVGGTLSGLVIGLGVTHSDGDNLPPGALAGIAIGVTGGMSGVGALIGAALPGSFKTIYRAP